MVACSDVARGAHDFVRFGPAVDTSVSVNMLVILFHILTPKGNLAEMGLGKAAFSPYQGHITSIIQPRQLLDS